VLFPNARGQQIGRTLFYVPAMQKTIGYDVGMIRTQRAFGIRLIKQAEKTINSLHY
jgi:hypothetical protein